MRMLPFFIIVVALLAGCKWPSLPDHTVAHSRAADIDPRLQSTGVVRIRSAYTLPSGNFKSTCSGTLLHAGDQSFKECVVLSSAHCFKNLPKATEHRIEFLDGDGQVAKIFATESIHLHPSFTATEALFAMEQSAVDAALLRFKCNLPATVRSAQILNHTQVPASAQLLVANFGTPEVIDEDHEPSSPSWVDQVVSEDQASETLLVQRRTRLQSLDFPLVEGFVQGDGKGTEKLQPGVVSLEDMRGTSLCDVDSGQPAFFDAGTEMYLVATLSRAPQDCMKGVVQGTLLAPLVSWMEGILGTGVVAYTKKIDPPAAPKVISSIEQVGRSAAQLLTNSTAQQKFPNKQTTQEITQTLPALSTPSPSPSPSPSQTPAVSSSPANVTVNSGPTPEAMPSRSVSPTPTPWAARETSPLRKANMGGKPKVPPIAPLSEEELAEEELGDEELSNEKRKSPPPENKTEDEFDEERNVSQGVCKGTVWVVNSKSRVWGTVIKLVDKELSQITDETMKCDMPNEVSLCLKEKPVPANYGSSKSVLMQSISLNGCGKFKAEKTIYFQLSDFSSR